MIRPYRTRPKIYEEHRPGVTIRFPQRILDRVRQEVRRRQSREGRYISQNEVVIDVLDKHLPKDERDARS